MEEIGSSPEEREETGFGNEGSNRSLGWSVSKVVEKVQGLSLC